MLTKDDVRILRWACLEMIRSTTEDASGDLYYEEREELRRALRNLPKIKSLKKGSPLPDYRLLEAKEWRALRKGIN